jgi:hypothetical protein
MSALLRVLTAWLLSLLLADRTTRQRRAFDGADLCGTGAAFKARSAGCPRAHDTRADAVA